MSLCTQTCYVFIYMFSFLLSLLSLYQYYCLFFFIVSLLYTWASTFVSWFGCISAFFKLKVTYQLHLIRNRRQSFHTLSRASFMHCLYCHHYHMLTLFTILQNTVGRSPSQGSCKQGPTKPQASHPNQRASQADEEGQIYAL